MITVTDAWRKKVEGGVDRDVDAMDAEDAECCTTLLFLVELSLELCVKLLAEVVANLDHRDRNDDLAMLHMAARYVRPGVAKVLLDLGEDREVADECGRTTLDLTQEILKAKPKGNPFQFGRKIGLEGVVRVLEGAMFEYAEVEEILEQREKEENLESRRWWRFLNGEGRERIWSNLCSGRTVVRMSG
ncbi:signal recognition particle 43 kDa protein, chloroplastic-like [Vigna umbellata]|uniref:signal recognition particle 43 kDa protein, chloroplastic-like n=1 Tax=Vigna umbellata TaxID=87088 RepID=UPI001F5F11F2|nr:signal recognition particle 43 kDa protein, chloroplastic-like [Vigna umbellata]